MGGYEKGKMNEHYILQFDKEKFYSSTSRTHELFIKQLSELDVSNKLIGLIKMLMEKYNDRGGRVMENNMATQEAIDIIKKIINYIEIAVSRGSAKNPLPIISALCMGIEALEKQISKQPRIIVNEYPYGYSDVCDDPYEIVCPACGEELDELEHHCKCGQAIDWSDIE